MHGCSPVTPQADERASFAIIRHQGVPRRSWRQDRHSPFRLQPLAWKMLHPGWQAAVFQRVRGLLEAPPLPGGQALLQALRLQLQRLAWRQRAAAGRAQVSVCASVPAEQSSFHVQ